MSGGGGLEGNRKRVVCRVARGRDVACTVTVNYYIYSFNIEYYNSCMLDFFSNFIHYQLLIADIDSILSEMYQTHYFWTKFMMHFMHKFQLLFKRIENQGSPFTA